MLFPSMQFFQNVNELKNFHFTQNPDRTNDMNFLKSPKPCFGENFDHFWSFLLDGDFFQKIQLSLLFGSLTLCQVSEKTNEPILKKLTDRCKDRQTDHIL